MMRLPSSSTFSSVPFVKPRASRTALGSVIWPRSATVASIAVLEVGMHELYIPTCAYSSRSVEKGEARLDRQRLAGAVGAFEHLPVVAVAGTVVQGLAVADRRPLGGLRRVDDLDRQIDLGGGRRKGFDDRHDLVRVDAPHARVAELAAGLVGRLGDRLAVAELGDDAVRRRLAVGMAGGGDLELGAQHQRVGELACGAHAGGRDRTAVRRDE